jgi:hypothetical protein
MKLMKCVCSGCSEKDERYSSMPPGIEFGKKFVLDFAAEKRSICCDQLDPNNFRV